MIFMSKVWVEDWIYNIVRIGRSLVHRSCIRSVDLSVVVDINQIALTLVYSRDYSPPKGKHASTSRPKPSAR